MASADVMAISSPSANLPHLDNPSPTILDPSSSLKRKMSSDIALLDMAAVAPAKKLSFDPRDHLNFTSSPKLFTMKDLGLPEDTGVSPIAVSEPFQLFTPEAVQQMRAEGLSKQVWENYQYTSNLSQCQLRGYAPE